MLNARQYIIQYLNEVGKFGNAELERFYSKP